MKIRDSGMPDETMWQSYFRPEEFLKALELDPDIADVLELGCGYGTFTLPAAEIIAGRVFAIDIDSEMVARVAGKARTAGLSNVVVSQRDFLRDGTGLPDGAVDYVMAFNILHGDDPGAIFAEARRVLVPRGRLAVMHWIPDPSTPRGPDLAIRPRPEQCLVWAEEAGFRSTTANPIDLPPYHYGWVFGLNH